jgi:citrate lyase subunit beta/citryl-CoA lyase
VNGLTTGLTKEDLKFAIREGVDGIMLPKSESKEDILELKRLMKREEKEKELAKIGIIPLLETAKGILNAYEIASVSDRVLAISFGAADYMRDFGRSYFTMSPDESELLYARSRLAVAARTAEVLAVDTPFLGVITDKEGLVRESKIASSLGFNGKLCIHPMHIEPINRVFSPSEKDVDSARKIVKEYGEAKARGAGATSVEGRMVDEATYKMAKETLMISEMISKKFPQRQNG